MNAFHALLSSRLVWSLLACLCILALFFGRRASLAYLWRSLHLIEDLVLEKEFLSKIDLPLKLLLLTLLCAPFIGYLPSPYCAWMARLETFLIPFLLIHTAVQGFDLVVFQWYFEKHKEANLPAVFRVIVISMIYAVVLLVLLQHVYGLNVLPLIATSTVVTAVLGLALQDTLKNVFAGLTLSLDKRFQQGDWITYRPESGTAVTGEISEIGWRSVRLRTTDNNYLVVPNASFATAHITNFSRPLQAFNKSFLFPVPATYDMSKVAELLSRAMKETKDVLASPEPEVIAYDVKIDQVTFRLRFWLDKFEQGDKIASLVMQECIKLMQQQKIRSEPKNKEEIS